MTLDNMSVEEWAGKIADDIVGNRHSYSKHCQNARELMQLDGSPATRAQYHNLILRTLKDPKATGRTFGEDKSSLAIYSHETKMVVLINPRMTGDANTAFPLAGKAPLKFSDSMQDIRSYALKNKSIHNGLIYNHGDGVPHNPREAFQEKFETRDMSGRFTGRNRNGDRVQPVTGENGPFAEWLKNRAAPQRLSRYFGEQALGATGRAAPAARYTPGYVVH